MKVLVTGSRNWKDGGEIEQAFRFLPDDTVVVHGAAAGADTVAGVVAKRRGLEVLACPANWVQYGKSAGPIRNRQMLDHQPAFVLAFHADLEASRGTKDCVDEAVRRGIPVVYIGPNRA